MKTLSLLTFFLFPLFSSHLAWSAPDPSSFSLQCQDQNFCPEAVALLRLGKEGNLKSCTGFLIHPSFILTSGSCLPENLQEGSRCEDSISIQFTEHEDLPSRATCKQVVSVTRTRQEKRFVQDHALLELRSPSEREPLIENHEGFSDKMTFILPRIDEYYDKKERILRKDHCRVEMETSVLPQFFSRTYPLVTLSGCYHRPSNQGAPLLDEQGQVRGLLFSKFIHRKSPKASLSMAASLASLPLKSDTRTQRNEKLQTLRSHSMPNASNRSEALKRIRLNHYQIAQVEIKRRFEKWAKQRLGGIRWRLKEDRPEPDCLEVQEDSEKDQELLEGKPRVQLIALSHWKVTVYPEINFRYTHTVTSEFNPRKYQISVRNDQAHIEIYKGKKLLQKKEISVCRTH